MILTYYEVKKTPQRKVLQDSTRSKLPRGEKVYTCQKKQVKNYNEVKKTPRRKHIESQ